VKNSAKRDNDARESLILIPIALIVTLACTFWAWKLAANQFASPPVSNSPGTIFLATEGRSSNQNPFTAYAVYEMSGNGNSTRYLELSIQQKENLSARSAAPPGVIMFLCGEAAVNPEFSASADTNLYNWHGKKVIWKNASAFSQGKSNYYVYTTEFPAACVYAVFHLSNGADVSNGGNPPTGYGEVVLVGTSGTAPSKVSGAEVNYVWPGILNAPASVSTVAIDAVPLSNNSLYGADFYFPSGDISNVVTTPALTQGAAGYFTEGSLNNGSTEFRITGELADNLARGQEDVFIAGALVGIAGAGAILFLEMLVKALLVARKSFTDNPEAPESQVKENLLADGETAPTQFEDEKNRYVILFRWPRRR
jgi:hypothetical protein